jgi:GNAT superfamily N-acetyltransferase
MQVRAVPYEQAMSLVTALSDELTDRYGGGPASVAHPEQFLPPYGVFLLLSVHGEDVACGGVRRLSEEGVEGFLGEIKRMYVAPSARGRGLSRVLLRALVEHGRSLGMSELWLETGIRQPEAMALYESEGFAPIPRYGQYKGEEESRCYTLVLG